MNPVLRLIVLDEKNMKLLENVEEFQRVRGVVFRKCAETGPKLVRETYERHKDVPREKPWVSYLFADNTTSGVIGTAGFLKNPENGEVEIFFHSLREKADVYILSLLRQLSETARTRGVLRLLLRAAADSPYAPVFEQSGFRAKPSPDGQVVWEKELA